jgi:hypothetical protein
MVTGGETRAERAGKGEGNDDAAHTPRKAGSLRPPPFGGLGHAPTPAIRGRSAPRPPPPPQPSAPTAPVHATTSLAGYRPLRRSAACARIQHLIAPFGGIDAAQQAQQGPQLRSLPATLRAIEEMAVERGTLGLHEAAHQVGTQREADIVLSAHRVTAPRKSSDRITCPLTVPGVIRFTGTPGMWPRPSLPMMNPPASQSARTMGEHCKSPRLLRASLGRIVAILRSKTAQPTVGRPATGKQDYFGRAMIEFYPPLWRPIRREHPR